MKNINEMDFYKTKLSIEVEIETQFGPRDAIDLISNSLNCPAVKSIIVSKVDTDYIPYSDTDSQKNITTNVPLKIR